MPRSPIIKAVIITVGRVVEKSRGKAAIVFGKLLRLITRELGHL